MSYFASRSSLGFMAVASFVFASAVAVVDSVAVTTGGVGAAVTFGFSVDLARTSARGGQAEP